ncbi:MAG: phosphodiesterase [Cyanobacteria bacterium RYN_339]|nr:phosphodiesterase [Cyanobacteria bacterium RYN_339]
MRIGIVSDTHLPHFGGLPRALVAGLQGVDLILHTGDFTGDEVPALFEAIAPLEAVAGNNDGPGLVLRYGRTKVVTLAGVRIGLTHGDDRRHPARAVARHTFKDVDVVCYGHSHVPECTQEAGVWYLNPGSPTDKRRMPDYSYGILELADGRATPTLYHFTR